MTETFAPDRCFMPDCPNKNEDVPTIVVDVGDETGPVLRSICADCLD